MSWILLRGSSARWRRRGIGRVSSVHLAAVADSYYPDDQFPILDLANEAVITDAIAPLFVVSLECLAAEARIDRGFDLVYQYGDALLYGLVQPIKHLRRCGRHDDFIPQRVFSILKMGSSAHPASWHRQWLCYRPSLPGIQAMRF